MESRLPLGGEGGRARAKLYRALERVGGCARGEVMKYNSSAV